LRFVHVTTFFPPEGFGGDAIQAHRVIEGLGARGHEVRVVHSPDAFEAGEGARTQGMPALANVGVTPLHIGRSGLLTSYLAGRPIGFAKRLRELIDGADVVHFHNPSLIGGPGALLLDDRPLAVYTTHEHWLLCPTHVLFRYGREPCERPTCLRCTVQHRRPPQMWRYGSLLERAVGRLDLLISPSEFTANRHRISFPNARIEALPHPPPSPESVAAAGEPPSHPRPYILFAGRLEPIKGARWLVDALRDDPGVDVVIAGDGTELEAIRSDVRDLAHVHLLGKVPHEDVLRWARGAVALVIPSVGYETGGGVGLEAMAFGTPLLVRDLGALPELVRRGGGLTFHDKQALRSAIERLVNEPGLAARLRREAATSADPVAGDSAFFGRYFELIADVAAQTGRDELARRASAARQLEEQKQQ
jgi:glycosyltransferase involved in cell wall biosynthesis